MTRSDFLDNQTSPLVVGLAILSALYLTYPTGRL